MNDRSESPFVEFAAGASLYAAGVPATAVFIVEDGTVAVTIDGRSVDIGAGGLVGETALLQPPAPTHAVARTQVRALRIEAALLPAVLRDNPGIALALLRQITQRLHAADAAISAHGFDTQLPPDGNITPVPPAQAPIAPGTFVLDHAEGRIVLPPGKLDCLVGRPDPATGAVPEVNLGPLDLARSLSRRHARLLLDGDGGIAVREEPGTSNGTWVNGERLVAGQTLALKRGDKLRFGAIEVELGAG